MAEQGPTPPQSDATQPGAAPVVTQPPSSSVEAAQGRSNVRPNVGRGTPSNQPNVIAASVLGTAGVVLATTLLCLSKINQVSFIICLIMTIGLSLYVLAPERWHHRQLRSGLPVDPASVPRAIAFTLMGLFGTALMIAGGVAAYKSDDGKDWVDAFKSGFLLLGGGVTTIVGYYFGSRQTSQAVEAARQAQGISEGQNTANVPVQGLPNSPNDSVQS